MKTADVTRSDGSILCSAGIADNLWTRFRGLLGRKSLNADEGLIIQPCTSVHTFFMRFPIDVLYLDNANTVVKMVSVMKAARMSFGGKGAKKVLELRAETIERRSVSVGEQFTLAEHENQPPLSA